MSKRITQIVAAGLVGALITLAVPAGAHHSTSTYKLKRRLARLETHVNEMNDYYFAEVTSLKARIAYLEDQTRFLMQDGVYIGNIQALRVYEDACPDLQSPAYFQKDSSGRARLYC